jgi:hypothetical protein
MAVERTDRRTGTRRDASADRRIDRAEDGQADGQTVLYWNEDPMSGRQTGTKCPILHAE